MGRSIVIKVVIAAILFVAYIVAVAMGLPDSFTGPVFFGAIAIVMFFPVKSKHTAKKPVRGDNHEAARDSHEATEPAR